MESINIEEMERNLLENSHFFTRLYQGLKKSNFNLKGIIDLLDFKDRTITYPKWDKEFIDVYQRLFYFFTKRLKDGIKGVCLTRYNNTNAEIKIGIRYDDENELVNIGEEINKIVSSIPLTIEDTGFSRTLGICHNPPLPPRIVVDYIKCKSFEWFIKLGNNILHLHEYKAEIEKDIINSSYILRNEKIKDPLNDYEISVVWERFVHHILNINTPINEYSFKIGLRNQGILII